MSLFLFYSAPVDRGTRTASACLFYLGGSSFLRRLCGGTSCVSNTPLTGGVFFAEPQREGFAAPRGGGKRVDTCGFYPLNSRFPLFLSLAHTRDRRPLRKGERQRSFSTVSFSTYSKGRIPYCYTCGLICAGATYPCRANPWHVVTHGICEFRCLVQFILAGAVCHIQANELRDTGMSRLLR